jgi:hypothetical protein
MKTNHAQARRDRRDRPHTCATPHGGYTSAEGVAGAAGFRSLDPMGHHVVPKLHLREFADDQERVALVSRGSLHRVATPGIDNVLNRKGFYTTQTESGKATDFVEGLLSQIEAQAAMSLRRLRQGRFPPRPLHRINIAAFLALQAVRGPDMRAAWDAMAGEMWRQLNRGLQSEALASRFQEIEGRPPTRLELADLAQTYSEPDEFAAKLDRNHQALLMFDSAYAMIDPLLRRSWQLIEFPRPQLLTSDRPVTVWANPARGRFHRGFGIINADEVRFPVDRRRALVMWLIRAPSGQIVRRGTDDDAREMNESVAAASREWIVHHPDDDPLADLEIPEAEPTTRGFGPGPGGPWSDDEPFAVGVEIPQPNRSGRPLTV